MDVFDLPARTGETTAMTDTDTAQSDYHGEAAVTARQIG